MARTNNAWMSFKGVRTDQMGVQLIRLPDRPRAQARGERIEVPGRSGNLWIPDGGYDSIQIKVGLRLVNGANRDAVSAWLTGKGDLIFSDDSDRCYRAHATALYTYERFLPGAPMHNFEVEFACQPFKYMSESGPIETSFSGTVPYNPGTVASEPRITLYGNGNVTLYVCGRALSINGMSNHIVIDGEAKTAYMEDAYHDPDVLMTGKVTGDWPIMEPGHAPVSWVGNVSRVVIQPNWRWL